MIDVMIQPWPVPLDLFRPTSQAKPDSASSPPHCASRYVRSSAKVQLQRHQPHHLTSSKPKHSPFCLTTSHSHPEQRRYCDSSTPALFKRYRETDQKGQATTAEELGITINSRTHSQASSTSGGCHHGGDTGARQLLQRIMERSRPAANSKRSSASGGAGTHNGRSWDGHRVRAVACARG
jgi:hypothetical protein